MPVSVSRLLGTAGLALAVALPAAPQDGAPADPTIDLFVRKCASCHTVGKGDRVGPDLTGVHARRDRAWLARMIQTPSSLLNVDAEARKLLEQFGDVRMPDLGLEDAEVDALIALIERCSAEPCELAGKFVPITEATADHIALGEDLFTGRVAIKSGAVPCNACHTVDTVAGIPGGTLSKNLTTAFGRLTDEGLDAALMNPTFDLMNKVYVDHPLDKDEVFALRAFLYEANRAQPSQVGAWSLLIAGLAGTALVLAVLNGFWRRRLLGVRSDVQARKGVMA